MSINSSDAADRYSTCYKQYQVAVRSVVGRKSRGVVAVHNMCSTYGTNLSKVGHSILSCGNANCYNYGSVFFS